MMNEKEEPKAAQTLEKCRPCYFKNTCMLTVFMAKSCLGAYRDTKERLGKYDNDIKDK